MASDRFDLNILPFTSNSLCVVHKIMLSNVLSMVIWPQNQLLAKFTSLQCRQGLHCHPSPNTHLVNLPDSGRHVTRVNQGLFSTTMEAEKRDPGNEVGPNLTATLLNDVMYVVPRNSIFCINRTWQRSTNVMNSYQLAGTSEIFSLDSIASSRTNHKFTNAFLLLFFKFESCNDHAADVYKPQRCYSVHGI